MARMESYTILIEAQRPDEVEAVRRALGDADIPFRSGLMPDVPPRVIFSVPSDRVAHARAAIVGHVPTHGWIEDRDDDALPRAPGLAPPDERTSRRRPAPAVGADPDERVSVTRRAVTAEEAMDGLDEILGEALGLVATDLVPEPPDRTRSPHAERPADEGAVPGDSGEDERARFPARSFALAASLVVFHAVLVLVTGGAGDVGRELLDRGVLLRGSTLAEPWRLLTSLALHADLRHVLANGLSTVVFAVPLLEWVGLRRAAGIYLAAGVGGSLTALSLARVGQGFLGSSGAVAGLFGAWAVLALERARHADLPRRARIRALGIAFLVLPGLLTPFTPDGKPISVASHIGGLVTGMLVGALLSGLVARLQGDDPLFDA
jgi:membrane associated rhomboid family serine protease